MSSFPIRLHDGAHGPQCMIVTFGSSSMCTRHFRSAVPIYWESHVMTSCQGGSWTPPRKPCDKGWQAHPARRAGHRALPNGGAPLPRAKILGPVLLQATLDQRAGWQQRSLDLLGR